MARLHAQCFETPRPWRADEFESLLWSSFLETSDAGFILGRVVADEAELLTLAVAPERRRLGQGSALVCTFLEKAQELGATRAFLEVAADNAAALALYKTAGFEVAGQRRAYYTRPDGSKVDAIVMACAIAAQ